MAPNVVASTSSALAAGLLRYELSAARVTRAAGASIGAGQAPDDLADSAATALPIYDARGRVAAPQDTGELVSAVGEMLRSEQGVEVDAALLRRVHEFQGTLLDVLA